MSIPTVSIIVPCYNHARLIEDTVNSIRRQTFDDWECIIINDGSTDDSGKVCLALAAEDDRILYVSQPNKGPSGARNRGMEEIRGRYVQFIDADDIIAENKLELQVTELSKTDELALAYCDFQWCNEAGEPVTVPWDLRVQIDPENPLKDIALYWQTQITIPPCCFLFDARFFTDHGIREDESIRANEDYDLLLRVLALKPRIFFQNEKLAQYRIVPGSVSTNLALLRRTYFHIIRRHERILANDREMLTVLQKKRHQVKRDFWYHAPPHEFGWWKSRARSAARKILPKNLYHKLKRLTQRGQ